MSVVIKKLTHPNSLTHQYYKQKWMKFFLVGFIEREREIKFSAFQGLFFQNFLTFFFAPLIFLTFRSLFLYFSLFFSKMGRIFRANDEMGGQHNCNMLHLCQPPIFATSSAYFVFFFFFFILIFAQLFGGLSELHFLQTLYAQKALDVWFPTVIASLDLELRSSRYSARKEGDAELKNSEMFFLEKFISSNPKQISLNPFDENQLRPCSSRWSRLLVPILAQLVQFIVQSRVKNGLFFLKKVKILF